MLEANLFDYDGDLYGQCLNVFLLDFIRPERAFDSFDALKEQIALDAQTARQFHRATGQEIYNEVIAECCRKPKESFPMAKDLKQTVFLPKTDFPMRAGLPQKGT